MKVDFRPLQEDSLGELFNVASDREIWRMTSVDYSDPAIFYPNFKAAMRDSSRSTLPKERSKSA